MRRIALVNQKGGVGKTTTAVNLGAALAHAGRRVVLVDLDPQGNLSTHLGVEVPGGAPSTYSVLCDGLPMEAALQPTAIEGLSVLPTNIDLSGAEMELAASFGRESILNDAVNLWAETSDADYLIFDCPPSLGLLSVNGLVAANEVFIALQTEFFALQGMSKLVEIVQLLKRRLNPDLEISGIIPCLYDSRLRLAREVLGEIRRYFPGPVFRRTVRTNVKLAEAPSYGQSIFEYAPKSPGAGDYRDLAVEVMAQEPEASVQPAPTPEAEATPAQAPAPKAETAPAQASPIAPEIEPVANAAAEVNVEIETEAKAEVHNETEVDKAAAVDVPIEDVTLTPLPKPEVSVLRADDLPALPEDAFRTSGS